MSHTPGPWDVDDDTMEIFSITPGHSTGWIARVLGNDDNGRPLTADEMESNARLIAAAPDLLSAARLANQELLDIGQGSSGSPALVALWAAIAKAEGRE